MALFSVRNRIPLRQSGTVYKLNDQQKEYFDAVLFLLIN